jgi:hypothetical protein
MKIDNIFEQAIEFNKELIEERASQKAALGEVAFAKEYATVSLGLGRQIGKTMAIARRAKPTDIVFSYNLACSKEMQRRLEFWNIVQHIEARPASNAGGDSETQYETVWIDDASHVKPEELNKIYESYAHRAKQFILIG